MKKALIVLSLAAVSMTRLSATVIDGKTNIFVAGQDSTGINTQGGLFPTVVQTFVPGAGQTVQFSATGATGCGSSGVEGCVVAGTTIGADGASLSWSVGPQTGTDISGLGTNGISGITFTGREMFLVGVFLDNNTPTGLGPLALTFDTNGLGAPGNIGADTFTTFTNGGAYALGQVFYIGDGRTGFNNNGGTTQTFLVPTTATRLFLGFAEASNNFVGPWGAYGDNTGSLNVTVSVQSAPAIPEPGTIMLMGLGLVGLAYLRRRIA